MLLIFSILLASLCATTFCLFSSKQKAACGVVERGE
jgi:hypothetical protein